jgi:hypothetical protein
MKWKNKTAGLFRQANNYERAGPEIEVMGKSLNFAANNCWDYLLTRQ